MTYYSLSALINCVTSFVLGFYVLSRNKRSPLNIAFSFFAFSTGAWAFCYFFWQVSPDRVSALFWTRSLMIGAILIPISFFHFILILLRIYNEKKKILFFSYLFSLVFIIANFTPLFVRDVVPRLSFEFWPTPGILFHPYLFVYFFGLAVYSHYLMIHAIRTQPSGILRNQIKYVFWGTLISYLGGSTNFFLWYNIPVLPLGNVLVVFYVITIAYAIVRHRLMGIELVVQRSAVYGIVTVFIMALYALAVIVSETFLRQIIGYTSLLVTAAAALLIAIVYQPLVRIFQNLSDRIFFRKRYDYRKTLQQISRQIASVIRLEELTRLIVSSFIDTMMISEISFLLLDREKEHFRSVPVSLPRYKKIEIDVGSPIVSWLSSTKDILVRDEVEDEISRQEALGKMGDIRRLSLEEVRDEMERLGIMVWVPIISKEELIGIIALGDKLSGDIFTAEDIGLLSTLAGQTAVALDNARLYAEVVNMRDYSEEILQSMVSGVMTVDTKAKIVTFNNMAEKITGRKADEVLGKSCEEIWGKRGKIPNVIANSLKDRCYINFESSVASPERGLVPVAFASTVLRDHQEKKIGALLTIRDLSEVKELEEKVRRADKLSALATMAAGMAHEIKNPLSSMKVFSQLLTKKFDDEEFRKKFTEVIPREINRIDRIVESLLSFARATALNFEKTDINEILEENLVYFDDQAKANEVKIIKNYNKELPEIEVDRGQISQVFSNLILNAIQAMAGGGELCVTCMPGKKVMDTIQNIKVQISDTGHGMSEETIQKLFDPFFTTKYGGTGLGMTISHNIVDGHRGYIDVESKVGKGTTFTVTLPVSQGLV
jgi:PAS domain S-box-containing protein